MRFEFAAYGLVIPNSQMISRSFRVHLGVVTDQTFAKREQPCVLNIYSELDFGSLVVTLLLVFTFGCLLTEVTARLKSNDGVT